MLLKVLQKMDKPSEGARSPLSKEGDNLLDVMKAQLKIVEKTAFLNVTVWNKSPAENKYWLFDVNGTMSPCRVTKRSHLKWRRHRLETQ